MKALISLASFGLTSSPTTNGSSSELSSAKGSVVLLMRRRSLSAPLAAGCSGGNGRGVAISPRGSAARFGGGGKAGGGKGGGGPATAGMPPATVGVTIPPAAAGVTHGDDSGSADGESATLQALVSGAGASFAGGAHAVDASGKDMVTSFAGPTSIAASTGTSRACVGLGIMV